MPHTPTWQVPITLQVKWWVMPWLSPYTKVGGSTWQPPGTAVPEPTC
ncbi:hypothetical protein [Pseudomonas abietaniphila]